METSEITADSSSPEYEKGNAISSESEMNTEQDKCTIDSPDAAPDEDVKCDEMEGTFSHQNFSSSEKDSAPQQDSDSKEIGDKKDENNSGVASQTGIFKEPVSIIAPRLSKRKTGRTAEVFRDQTEKTKDKESDLEEIGNKGENTAGTYEVKRFKYATPAEQIKTQDIPIPYKEPSWGTLCVDDYSFEVIKNGIVVDALDLRTKSFFVFGRLPSCDVTMGHPSLSRYHAVVQYCGAETDGMHVGWYLYDLDSTHGTWVNKVKVNPHIYVRLRVGYVIKFGGSSRLNILQVIFTARKKYVE